MNQTIWFEYMWLYMNINMMDVFFSYCKFSDLFRIYTNWYKYVLNLFANMHIARHQHTAALPDSRTLPRAQPDSRTLPHTVTLSNTAVPSAAHCRTLHEFEYRTPHTAYCTPHTVAHRN
jgi:hypothetical protein